MDSSPLAKLPGELRNNIYEFALLAPKGIELCFIKAPVQDNRQTDSTLQTRPLPPHGISPNLLATCKQIRHEALPALFANTFIIPLNWEFLLANATSAATALANWAAKHSTSAHPIKNIQFNYVDLGVEELNGITTFSKLLLRLLKPTGITPSIPLSFDLMLRAMDFDSTHIAHLDLGLKTAAENRKAISKAVHDAQVSVLTEEPPWRTVGGLGSLAYEPMQVYRWVRNEGEYIEEMVGVVQEGKVVGEKED
ncbi:hypothetical protein PRZ48_002650 [Zasmidium cellare]|uniref:2EXR domain-containing protein n=1 Tax=Zasmidium cellare TaxID=395010 RepID=A0ABR0ETG2_ZASCE|nr:hypothetical protein PRZ48_002650 [Zasmidium cellare]